MSVAEAMVIMIAFGTYTATIIFGMLTCAKRNKK